MYNIKVIANVFLSFSSMTQKKLQKLCYYAQAHYLAINSRSLVDSDFEAWVHGPVSPELYNRYKLYNWNLIPSEELESYVNESTQEFLEEIFSKYSKYGANELEEMTHEELPWIEARQGLEYYEPSNNVIDTFTMKRFYSRREHRLN